MNITIIGTGKMARAISTRLLQGSNNVSLIEHTPGKGEALAEELKGQGKGGSISAAHVGTLPGEVVVLAVPYHSAESAIHHVLELLPGKVLVDITNPINFQTMEPLFPGGSGAEEIARLAPVSTRVVKAFNTTFAGTLMAGQVAGTQLDVVIAGEDADAKTKVTQLIESGGMRPINAGLLVRACQLEALDLLHIALQSTNNIGFMSAIKILP